METKTCSKCHVEKDVNEFNWKIKTKGIRQSACKVCTKQEGKVHYKANSKRVIQKTIARNQIYTKTNLTWKSALCCVVCKEQYIKCLEFHHLDRNKKDFTVSSKLHNSSFGIILKEAERCVILCANCHRKVHDNMIILTTDHLIDNQKMFKQAQEALVYPLASNQWKG